MKSNPLTFHATPLTTFADGELYLDKYPGFLYEASNKMPSDHDAHGKAIGASAVPLDKNGKPTSNGKSNWGVEIGRTAAREPNAFDPWSGIRPRCRASLHISRQRRRFRQKPG